MDIDPGNQKYNRLWADIWQNVPWSLHDTISTGTSQHLWEMFEKIGFGEITQLHIWPQNCLYIPL